VNHGEDVPKQHKKRKKEPRELSKRNIKDHGRKIEQIRKQRVKVHVNSAMYKTRLA